MRVHLMFPDMDFHVDENKKCGNKEVFSDLGIDDIIEAMSGEDKLMRSVCSTALSEPLTDIDVIKYRQDVLKDCLRYPDIIRKIYDISINAEEKRYSSVFILSSGFLSATLSGAADLLKLYMESLETLRNIADENIGRFSSEGFRNFFSEIEKELPDSYFSETYELLDELKRTKGTLISARFGNYLQGVSYVLRQKKDDARWFFAPSYTVPVRDDSAAADINNRRERAINEAANAMAQSAEHLESFFKALRRETAFYIGALNLRGKTEKICFPSLFEITSYKREYRGLYDVSLALRKRSHVVTNKKAENESRLHIITGANGGGKTTFIKSIGQAQLMSQCGMFVCAEKLSFPVRRKIYTHFRKEEDRELKSGKLDEELERMSSIADHIKQGDLILFNESFSSTNEREGSEIFGGITKALSENGIEIYSVTHMYTYACMFADTSCTEFLRAGRERSFKIVEGMPEKTAYGEDIYEKVFGQ